MHAPLSPLRSVGVTGRRVGCALSIAAGLFWLGELYWSHLTRDGARIAAESYRAVIPPTALVIFVVAPSVACILGGVLTLRDIRGWR